MIPILRRYFIMVLLIAAMMCFTLAVQAPVYAEPGDSNATEAIVVDDDEDNDSGLISVIKNLISRIDAFFQAIEDLISGKALFEALKNWLYSVMDDAIRPILGVFGRTFLFTPSIAEQSWVRSGWNTAFFFSLGLFALAVVISGARIISARGVQEVTMPLKVLGGAMAAAIVSLYFVELCVRILNYLFDGIARQYLVELGAKCSLLGDPNSNVLDGNIILLATLVSPDQISDAVAQGQGINYFLGAAGGIWLSGFGTLFILILGFIVGLRYLTLCMLGMSAPAYFTSSALTGTWTPFAGWLNLYLRTWLLQVVFLIGWILMVAIRMADETAGSPAAVVGVSAMLVNLLVIAVVIVIAVFVWVIPAAKAIVQPLTLNGGEFIERSGNLGMKASKLAHTVSSRFGWDGIKDAAFRSHERSQRMREFGRDLKRASDFKTPAIPIQRSRLREYENPRMYDIQRPQLDGGALCIRVPENVLKGVINHLKASSNIPDEAITVHGRCLYIKSDYSIAAEAAAKDYCENLTPYWEAGNQYIVIQNGMPVRLPSPPDHGVCMGAWKK